MTATAWRLLYAGLILLGHEAGNAKHLLVGEGLGNCIPDKNDVPAVERHVCLNDLIAGQGKRMHLVQLAWGIEWDGLISMTRGEEPTDEFNPRVPAIVSG